MQLKDRVAIVTGGGQGLGEAIAESLAKEGCKVVVADIYIDKVNKAAEGIKKKYKTEVLGVQTDVTKEGQVKNMVNETVQKFGRIDILISNAGILIAKEITEFPEEQWRKVIEVNLVGYFLCAKETAKVMKLSLL